MLADNEALHGHTTRQESPKVTQLMRLSGIILRYITTEWNASVIIQLRQYCVQDLATHILKVDVNALWSGPEQICFQIASFIVNTSIESQLLHHIPAFGLAASDAHRAAPFRFR